MFAELLVALVLLSLGQLLIFALCVSSHLVLDALDVGHVVEVVLGALASVLDRSVDSRNVLLRIDPLKIVISQSLDLIGK